MQEKTSVSELPDLRANYSLMVSLDRCLRVTAADQEMLQRFRTPAGGLWGIELCDLLGPSIRTKVHSRLRSLLEGQQGRLYERSVDMLATDGVIKADLAGTSITRGSGQVDGVVVLARLHDAPPVPVERCARRRQLSVLNAKILEGVAAGSSTVQLATALFLSRGGIEYHMTALMRKMNAKNRTALISKAYAQGYFEIGSWPPRIVPERVA